jgi:hypothetical protein
LLWQLQTFSETADGLKARLEGVREDVRAYGADADLLAELDSISSRIPVNIDRELVGVLDSELTGVLRKLRLRHPPRVDPGLVRLLHQRIMNRVARIRGASGGDPSIVEKLAGIEAAINSLMASSAEDRIVLSRLQDFEYQFVNPLYETIVISNDKEGLLRATPR